MKENGGLNHVVVVGMARNIDKVDFVGLGDRLGGSGTALG
jgi:hypothetical protein